MKSKFIITALLCLFGCGIARTDAQDMDSELAKMTESLASQITNHVKKVTVLDFTDIDGNSTEIGKYIADQLTIDLVMKKYDLSVLDRAHLKRIMDEHKLTASGLIDPDTAKKLGQFAGVDAMIFGKVVSAGDIVKITATIETTDTAEVIGAGRAKFTQDEAMRQLASKPPVSVDPAKTDDSDAAVVTDDAHPSRTKSSSADTKPFGDLQAKVNSFHVTLGDRFYGFATFSITINNKSDTDTYGVALVESNQKKLDLSNDRGEEFYVTEVKGIGTATENSRGYAGSMTDISPKSSIIITGKAQVQWNGKPGDYRPYRIQAEVLFSPESQGRYPNQRTHNLVIDIK